MARCMLKSMSVPGRFWGEAVTTAVFILNRAPTRALNDKTPHEAWYGRKPAVHFLHTFGCVAHVKVAGGHLRKLDDRSTTMVMIGYEPGTKAYRLYNPATDRVHVSRDVVFQEGRAWKWDEDGTASTDGGDDDPFNVEYEYVYTPGAAAPGAAATPRAASRAPSVTSSRPSAAQSVVPSAHIEAAAPTEQAVGGTPAPLTPSAPATPPGVEFVSPPSRGIDLDADHDDGAPLRFRRLDDLLASTNPVEQQELMVGRG
ncbi:uncharacterized protein LOC111256233 [Setaria italica]|uniref:uncharacterized protein LOC111256233 n=1 Tax=Setaria italica TaxID=4555 RepID=UPI000BE59E07|nr:uncharacterized protein LOC111256233 [Setaria italica]